MNYLLPILAVLLSYAFVYRYRPGKNTALRLLLAFSGAFLLALTIFELFPSVYRETDPKTVGIFVMLGILLQIFLEFFSKGAEHGHMHLPADKSAFPWMLFLSLCLHAFLEGFPVERQHGLLYGILVHKIPIALILSIFLLNSNIRKSLVFMFILVFAFMTPLGTLAAATLPLSTQIEAALTSLVIGVFLHISTVILFESTEEHSFNLRKLGVIALGIIVAYLM